MRRCELCKSPASIYCDSDQAILCWDCDSKVHSANFLVARHPRNLLCSSCQSPTPWTCTGAKVGRTLAVCERCTGMKNVQVEERNDGGNTDEIEYDEDEFDNFSDSEREEEVACESEDGDDDIQVVRGTSSTLPTQTAPAMSPSSSTDGKRFCTPPDTEVSTTLSLSLKRSRESCSDLSSEEDLDSVRSRRQKGASVTEAIMNAEETTTDNTTRRPSIDRIRESVEVQDQGKLIVKLNSRIQQDADSGDNVSAAPIDLCKLAKRPGVGEAQPHDYL